MKSKEHVPQIIIEPTVLLAIEHIASGAGDLETGGVIAGTGSAELGEITITHASHPGPNSKATRFAFQHDPEFCQSFLDELAIETKGRIDYLGEWHKHFEDDPWPSSTDVRTLSRIARSPNYHVRNPLLLIVGQSNARSSLIVCVVNKLGLCQSISWKMGKSYTFY